MPLTHKKISNGRRSGGNKWPAPGDDGLRFADKRMTLASMLKGVLALLLPGRVLARTQFQSPTDAPVAASASSVQAAPRKSRRQLRAEKRQAKLDAVTDGGAERQGKRADRSGNVPQPTGPFAAPQFDAASIKIIKDVVYSVRPNAGNQASAKSRKGFNTQGGGDLKLALNIFLPPNASATNRLPLLVRIHGGGLKSGSRTANTPEMIDYARCGFVVASVDYRLTKANRADPAVRVNAILAANEDVRNAIRFLRSKAADYGIDPDRIATIGGSAGGAISLVNAVIGDDEVVGTSDYPGVSAKTQAAVSTGGTLIDRDGTDGLKRLRFDKDDTPSILFHAYPRDPGTGATWEHSVLATQKLFADAGSTLEVVKTPSTMHTVSLGVGTDYWPPLYNYLRQRLRLDDLAASVKR